MSNLKEGLRKALGMCNEKSCTSKCTQQLNRAMKLITQSNKDLLDRVKAEIIGRDEPVYKPVEDSSGETAEYWDDWVAECNNHLRAKQRSALQKIEDYVNGQ